jgi:hypothetical protein
MSINVARRNFRGTRGDTSTEDLYLRVGSREHGGQEQPVAASFVHRVVRMPYHRTQLPVQVACNRDMGGPHVSLPVCPLRASEARGFCLSFARLLYSMTTT